MIRMNLAIALVIAMNALNVNLPARAEETGDSVPFFAEQALFEPGTYDGEQCQYRIPHLLLTPAGTVLAFVEERVDSIDDHAKTNIAMKRSEDGGRSLSERQAIWRSERPLVSHRYAGSPTASCSATRPSTAAPPLTMTMPPAAT